jgi:cyclopropane-fatty-acyl-phospholipid synthase
MHVGVLLIQVVVGLLIAAHGGQKLLARFGGAGFEGDAESLGEHYPLTLRHWAANLQARQAHAIAEVGEARERIWRLYMLASAQLFEAGDITVYQTLAGHHDAPWALPLDRAELLTPTGARR